MKLNEPFTKELPLLFIEDWMNQFPLIAGMTTKMGGVSVDAYEGLNMGLHVNDDENLVILNRELVAKQLQFPLSTWVCSDQVHENKVVEVTVRDNGKGTVTYEEAIPRTDGLFTKEKGTMLALMFADCVPLYFYASDIQVVGVAHAGWRGTVQNIAQVMVEHLVHQGAALDHIHACIGPSIGACCYQVNQTVIDEVEKVLDGKTDNAYNEKSTGQFSLDLKRVNELLLKQAGILEEHIWISNYCTSCEAELFFSHRRDKGKTGRLMSFIALKED